MNGECLTQCIITKLYLQHLLTALFTMELLKESSKYDITTIQNHDTYLSCEIHKKASSHKCRSKRGDLCLSEKVSIIYSDPDTPIDKRTKLICKRHHRIKFLLAIPMHYLPLYRF